MFSPVPGSISRTVQYRKITKPLLERKRRARINRCLDELKDLMFTALEAEGENVDKLEKADILEFTVKHLQKITRRDPVEEAYKFQEGFSHCASEACSFLLSLPGLDSVVGRRLVEYLAKSVSRTLDSQMPNSNNKLPAAVAGPSNSPAAATMTPAAAAVAATTTTTTTTANNNNNNNSNVINNNNNNNPIAEAVILPGHASPLSNPPPTPPAVAAAVMMPTACSPLHQAVAPSPPLPHLLHKPVVALTTSNRGPHTVVRPKPTRPTFSRSTSSSPPNVNVTAAAAAAAAAAQRDPMWRPW